MKLRLFTRVQKLVWFIGGGSLAAQLALFLVLSHVDATGADGRAPTQCADTAGGHSIGAVFVRTLEVTL